MMLLSTWSWAGRCEGSGFQVPAGWSSSVGLCSVSPPQQVPAGQALAPSPSVQRGRALWRNLLPHQHMEFGLRLHHRGSWLVFLLIKSYRNYSLHWTTSLKAILYSGHPLESQILSSCTSGRRRQWWHVDSSKKINLNLLSWVFRGSTANRLPTE